ncbi:MULTISPECIES: cell division protein ZapA [unclassified Colwellia]|jgi:cell division protein ZapA|uniref:cell division protein ZapA n=1 Tax=unclassified Colwellia TaxID=196834 RepID=UPI0015F5190D|nr:MULTISPECIES: cell division protein ZapA [unclassified Colwellia]MBA6231652.1 cell division protein ZapA [Colwellia sp. MB02u-7]MBA6235516.1 cell division protein ZapA [Colwellia sp. MB02u-11]MBA6258070.1 cell division protein ZapA [Colwellia sp. MB3u-28]MBA6259764.1 cell division protein ZapA [Colwellia sp. MB3u-41]MBA6264430.1 cell division protein ZapA [Colwellia sp. Bg11-12]
MLTQDSNGISIEIMGKQHQFSCSAEQAEDLKQAASKLAVMCEDIKQQRGNASSERALLVASINLSYSLLMANNKIERYQHGQEALISTLKSAL